MHNSTETTITVANGYIRFKDRSNGACTSGIIKIDQITAIIHSVSGENARFFASNGYNLGFRCTEEQFDKMMYDITENKK